MLIFLIYSFVSTAENFLIFLKISSFIILTIVYFVMFIFIFFRQGTLNPVSFLCFYDDFKFCFLFAVKCPIVC